jgi:hypothetical protein
MAQSQTVMPLILDYRECSKIKSSFCDPLAILTKSIPWGGVLKAIEHGYVQQEIQNAAYE